MKPANRIRLTHMTPASSKAKLLTGLPLYLLLFSLGMSSFIDMLDFSIANVAVPSIAAVFGVSTSQGTWVITLYAVTSCISLALTGRLALRFGSAKLAIGCTFLFAIMSLLCGLAWSFSSLLIFRMLQGVVGGCLSSIPQSLILSQCPREKKDLIFGFFFVCIVVPTFMGPVIGGWITETYGWRWIFFINVPIGIASALISWLILRDRFDPPKLKGPLDLPGFFFLAFSLMFFQIFLDRGRESDWFESNAIVALALSSFALFVCFLIWNGYANNPLIDLSFLKNRNFFCSAIATCGTFFVASVVTIILPLWLQIHMGYTPFLAGLASMPIGIFPLFLTPLIGAFLLPYRCLRLLSTLGVLVFSASCFWYSLSTVQISLSHIMTIRLFQGLGVALSFLALFRLALTYVNEKSLTKATSLYHFLRLTFTGAGVATAVAVTLWEHRAAVFHANLTEVLHPLRPQTLLAYHALKVKGIEGNAAAQVFEGLVNQQAYLLSYNDLHWLCGWFLLGILPIIWLCSEPIKKADDIVAFEGLE